MKKKSIIGLFAALLGFGMTTTSCEDMLTPDVENIAEGFTGTDTVGFYFGILSNLQDVYENNIMLGDLRSDLVETTSFVSDSVAEVANFTKVEDADNGLLTRAAYYKVINQCNFYLAKVDTMIMKNNNYYMRREFSQVQIIRAWTYMQLVQNYGTVPFITQPVDNANTGWETNPAEGWATADNLIDLLLKNGLNQAYQYEKTLGSVDYHTLENGKLTMAHALHVFPADLVLGDLYLLRGASQSDYERAATFYYDYLEEQARLKSRLVSMNNAASQMKLTINGRDYYEALPSSWATSFMDLGSSPETNKECITLMLSAANNTFGTVMTRSAHLYGFDASSSNTTGTNDEGTSVTTGEVVITPNYRNRQIAASKRYTNLSQAQAYRYVTMNNGQVVDVDYPENVGDARISGTVINVNTEAGTLPFVQKRCYYGSTSNSMGVSAYAGSFDFNYTFPVYRMRQVYLRYAEAINRAGYPRHAFALLRDGLTSMNIPSVRLDSVAIEYDADSTIISKTIVPYLSDVEDGCGYIGVNELRRAESVPFLDFTETYWDGNAGIHELGCGQSSDRDTVYTYANIVGQRIADEAARAAGAPTDAAVAKRYIAYLNEATEDTPTEGGTEVETVLPEPTIPATIGEEINAVETLIADEMALETAFEGTRFYDLSRIARHKNKDTWNFSGADYGTSWFAWTIARRAVDKKPYEDVNDKDVNLFNKLMNVENWYLQNPVY